ncbi:MAG: putative Ntn-hydrolase superfamily protein, partial [Litorivivens sp.]
FLGVLIPGIGAINTQAWYDADNQNNATNEMLEGWSPNDIIDWLANNDVANTPDLRQYGVVKLELGGASAAAHTGSSTDDYKGHRIGSNYAIQGNILLGSEVLDSMEARFLNTEGDLACKLMAAMQGANMIGADSRCNENGTSSLFAYLKVSPVDADMGDPGMLVSVRTHDGDGIEPVDSLQVLFNDQNFCPPTVGLNDFSAVRQMTVYPNPFNEVVHVESNSKEEYTLSVHQIDGLEVYKARNTGTAVMQTSQWAPGVYVVLVETGQNERRWKIVKE